MANIRSLALAMLCMMAGGLLLCGATAQAATRELTGSFGSSGPGQGTFGYPQSIAVEQTTGDVYVYDVEGGGRVYKFDAAGEPRDFSGLEATAHPNMIEKVGGRGEESEIAVDSSSGPDAGDIYVATGEEVAVYGSNGVKLGVLTKEEEEPCGVAVDPSGEVYVASYEDETIKKYTPVTNPVTKADYTSSLSEVGEVCNIAADSAGDIYAAGLEGSGGVTKYEASQFSTKKNAAVGTVIDPEGASVAVDPSSGDASSGNVYVDERFEVAEYGASGKRIGTFGESGAGALSEEESFGVAVDHASEQVYVDGEGEVEEEGVRESDGYYVVEIFGASLVKPEANTGAATGITRTTATLNGSVNPEGVPITSCEFEYGTTVSYGHSIACEQAPIGEGSEQVPVSANLSGLAAGATYYYRLVAVAEDGEDYYGLEGSFAPLPAVEGVRTAGASEVLATSATLNGSLEPNGFDTHYFFQYIKNNEYHAALGSVNAYESTTTEAAGELHETKQVLASATGLEPNETYLFRLVAENSFGATPGSLVRFTTGAVKPVIYVLAAGVTSTTAGLTDALNPENSPTKYHFVYGSTEEYGYSTPEATLASGFGEESVDGGVISELQPGTTLYYRLIATNTVGTSEGPPQTLTTSLATPPTAITAGASGVSQNAATISGTVSTNGLQTSYGFEIGTEAGDYGPATGLGSLGGATTETVTLTLAELQPGTTYHYRVTATSLDGTSYGSDQTFTTAGYPTLLTAPQAPPLIATPTIAFPAEAVTTSTTTATRTLTRAQKLAKALKACKQDKQKSKRATCERQARKKYGPLEKKSKERKKRKKKR